MHPKLADLAASAGHDVDDSFFLVVPVTSSLRDREESRRRLRVQRMPGAGGLLPAKLFGRMLKGQSAHDMCLHTQMYLGLTATDVVWLRRRLWRGGWVVHYEEPVADMVFEVEVDPLMDSNRVFIGDDQWWVKRGHVDDLVEILSVVSHEG